MNNNLKKYSFKLIALFLLLVGVAAAYFLSQQSQDVRQQASDGGIADSTTVNLENLPTEETITDPRYIGPPEASEEGSTDPRYIGPPETIGEDLTKSRHIGAPETIGTGGNSECYYQEVQCFQAPCDPILVCPSPTPSPSPKVCIEECPGEDGVLRSCTPPEADGYPVQSLCNESFSGRTESCGGVQYCCDEGKWTTDIKACPPTKPSPYPSPPAGCYYQEMACIQMIREDGTQAPCKAILVCPSPTPSPIPSPIALSGYCQSCNGSLPPETPGSRCIDGLVCHNEEPECVTTEYGTACPTIVGASGLCVKPGESIAVCQQTPTPISLAGDTLPDDPRINFQKLTLNELLLPFQSNIFSKIADLNSSDLTIENYRGETGYAEFFTFYPTPGMSFEILAKELDSDNVGNYINITLYGPDKKKITNASNRTRIRDFSASRLPHYLAVHTFDNKQGRAEITVTNEMRINHYFYTKRIDQDMRPLTSSERIGRKAADFFLQVPRIDGINNEYITYTSQANNVLKTEIPRIKVMKTCPMTGEKTEMPIIIKKFNNPNNEPLRETQMKIYPALTTSSPEGEAYYPPGYNYTVMLEYPNHMGVGTIRTARFSTTSKSGIAADLNDDVVVDIGDYGVLVSEMMQSNNSLVSDLNCDGIVDIGDYSLLISNISL